MATFEAQVNGITNLGIDGTSTDPGQTELTQFLNDGIIDVTNRIVRLRPQDKEQFTRVSGEVTSNGSEKVARASILSIVRESGTNNDWRPCKKISPAQQSVVTDIGSLHFASKYYPVYMVAEDGAISVFPAPGSDPNAFKVYYVNNDPRGDDDNSVAYGTSGLAFFPKDKVYLVVIYAAIKSLQASLSAVDISTFSSTSVSPVAPASPSISSPGVSIITIDALPTAPVYTPPVITTTGTDSTILDLTKLDTASWTDVDYDFDDENIDPLKWFQLAGDFIQNEEDTELAQVQLQKISTYIQAYSVAMQSRLNTFNDQNVDFQAGVQKNLQQAQINMQDALKEADLTLQASVQDYTLELQKYSADLQKYQANVAQEVQTYQQEIAEKGAEYQWQVARLQDLKQEYNQAFVLMAPPQAQASPSRGARR